MTKATAVNNMMRFISITSLPQGESRRARRLYNAITVASMKY
jgi:hypothetical protein